MKRSESRSARGRAYASDGEVRTEGALVALEAFAVTFIFQPPLQNRKSTCLVSHAEPEHARRSSRRKCARPRDCDVERTGGRRRARRCPLKVLYTPTHD